MATRKTAAAPVDPSVLTVTCSACNKSSDIMAPAPSDDSSTVVWKCPTILENGVDMCGQLNESSLS